MGQSNSSSERFLSDWVQLKKQDGTGSLTKVWAKQDNQRIQMVEYHLGVTSQQQVQKEKRIHQLRHNHPQLVSSLHFKDQTEQQFCASNYKGKIYIERIPLTLQTVTDIPFPDALHVYSQSLQGFHILSSQVENACFPISQENIGINSQSVCKVWMNNHHDRNYPGRNQRIPEDRMVKNIIDTIQENLDFASLQGRPKPSQYIFSKSQSQSNVRFGEAINLLRHYVNEYFGGSIPPRLSCVEKVGGAFQLSKNWNHRNSQTKPISQQKSQLMHSQSDNKVFMQKNQPTPIYPTNNIVNTRVEVKPQSDNDYSYTSFKRQAPILRNPPVVEPIVSQPISYRSNTVPITPSFKQLNEPSRVHVVSPNIVIPTPAVNYQQVSFPVRNQSLSTTVGKPQQLHQRNLLQNINLTGVSQVRTNVAPVVVQPVRQAITMKKSLINFVTNNNAPHGALKESYIQNRIVNNQVNVQVPVINNVKLQQSKVVDPTVTQVVRPKSVQLPQQVNVVQQHQTVVTQQASTVNIRKGAITFANSNTVVPLARIQQSQVNSNPTQTASLYEGPTVISHSEPQKVDSKLVLLQRSQPIKFSLSNNTTNFHLRNNQESISSINAQTNVVRSNEQLSNQFSLIKQEGVDVSTRNFYNNMLNGNNTGDSVIKTNNNDNSYYATYTSKLYDNSENDNDGYNLPVTAGKVTVNADYISSNTVTNNKYNVSIDDGMSSAAFLNELKNMKFSSTTPTTAFKKTEQNFDFGKTYQSIPASTTSYQISNQQQKYQVDYQDYNTTISDGGHHQDDLVVVGQRINMTPINALQSTNRQNLEELSQYRMSYEYQQGETVSGNIRYQTEHVKVNDNNGSYEQDYYSQTDYQQENEVGQQQNGYQSVFNKYAAYNTYDNARETSSNYANSRQHELNEQSKNSVNTTAHYHNQNYNSNSPSREEEYKVDFDPEILADLQKLKGVN